MWVWCFLAIITTWNVQLLQGLLWSLLTADTYDCMVLMCCMILFLLGFAMAASLKVLPSARALHGWHVSRRYKPYSTTTPQKNLGALALHGLQCKAHVQTVSMPQQFVGSWLKTNST